MMESFDKNAVIISIKIISKLMSSGELNEDNDLDLLNQYFNDGQIKTIVNYFIEENSLYSYEGVYGNYLCIIPNSARNDYAFNKTDLFEKYKLDNVSYMVFMFYTLCIFTILNDLNENNFKIDYLSSFCEKKIEKIKQDISSENINEKYNWDFNGLVKIWEELKDVSNTSGKKTISGNTSKDRILKKTMKILEEQKILEYYEGDINAVNVKEKAFAVIDFLSEDETFSVLKNYLTGDNNA